MIGSFHAMKSQRYSEYRKAKKKSRKRVNEGLGFVTMLALILVVGSVCWIEFNNDSPEGGLFDSRMTTANVDGRRQLELFPTKSESCEDYNPNLAIIFFLLTMYTFIGLAVITDEYFEPTLAVISEDLKLSPDVAGATFMAAGSSAPELLISVVDAFVSKASVGVGTILGSAMFNLLVIVGGSALIGKNKVDGGALVIQGYPLGRDCIFYTISLIMLCLFLLNDGSLCVLASNHFEVVTYDETKHSFDVYLKLGNATVPEDQVQCYVGMVDTVEAFLLTISYGVYVTYMRYNQQLYGWFRKKAPCCFHQKTKPDTVSPDGEEAEEVDGRDGNGGEGEDAFSEDEEDFPGNPIGEPLPASIGGKAYHILAFPFRVMFYYTMPTGMTNGIKKDLILFVLNIGWITVLTFAMVYVGTFTGCLIGVSPFLIGVLLLAIGTSVPDALASFIVARDGHGDMAISNALGSNVFNIFLGLGFPWFVSSLAFPGQIVHDGKEKSGNLVTTNGLVTGLLFLFSGTIILFGSLIAFKWRLQRPIAALLISYFFVFVIVIVLTKSCKINACIELECRSYDGLEEVCNYEPII